MSQALRSLRAIANPCAGRGRATTHIDVARRILSDAGLSIEVTLTEHAGHAEQIAAEAPLVADDVLLVAGGDGTVHEVVNGLARRADGVRPVLGIIPSGTGDALAHDLGLRDPQSAAQAVANGHVRSVDAARVTLDGRERLAISVIGWGLFASINQRAERLRWIGGARYTAAALLELMSPRLVAGAAHGASLGVEALLGAACMTSRTGRGMRIAPGARLDDGDIVLVQVLRTGRPALARVLRRVFEGTHVGSSAVEVSRVTELSFTLDEPGWLVVDGEMNEAREVRIGVERGALQVLAPPA